MSMTPRQALKAAWGPFPPRPSRETTQQILRIGRKGNYAYRLVHDEHEGRKIYAVTVATLKGEKALDSCFVSDSPTAEADALDYIRNHFNQPKE